MSQYVFRVLGHQGQVISQRYLLSYQAIGNMAAVVIPQAEMLRLFGETGGNTQAVLAPMREALNARGYTTLMVLPAQAQIVELVPTPSGGEPTMERLLDDAGKLQLESARLLAECAATLMEVRAYMDRLKDPVATALKSKVELTAHRVATAYVSKG